MGKICSLDFLGKKEFDLDILSTGGRKLFSRGDEITPEILASLYYKNIIVKEPVKTPEEIEMEKQKAKLEKLAEITAPVEKEKAIEKMLSSNKPISLEFDKEHATKVSELCYALGQMVGYNELKLEELKQAAYYYKIGMIKLTKEDLAAPDFDTKVANIGYDFLTLEMDIAPRIAEVTRDYMQEYNAIDFHLNLNDSSDIPYSHIVRVVDYYYKLINKASKSKDEALQKMLKLGGNKFNIFVLHKFLNMMRVQYE